MSCPCRVSMTTEAEGSSSARVIRNHTATVAQSPPRRRSILCVPSRGADAQAETVCRGGGGRTRSRCGALDVATDEPRRYVHARKERRPKEAAFPLSLEIPLSVALATNAQSRTRRHPKQLPRALPPPSVAMPTDHMISWKFTSQWLCQGSCHYI